MRVGLVVASLIIAAVLCEGALRLLYPKYRDVAAGQMPLDDMRIYAPVPNLRRWHVHPDTGRRHSFHTNNLGLRQNRNFEDADLVSATTVGVFGDSFTGGGLMDAPYLFTEPLDYLLNLDGDFTVLNFGVGGYGPAQSYFTYKSFRAREDLDYVLFAYFGGNDLHDLSRNGLFDLDADGRLRRREARGSAWWVPFASKLHLTYLALDATGRLAPYMATVLHAKQNISLFVRTVDVVVDPDFDLDVFEQLMRRWREEVEESGGKFFVVLLPTQPNFPLVRPLLDKAKIGVIDLNACYERKDEGHRGRPWRRSPYRFENDRHWNELGNRLAATCLDERLRREIGLPAMSEVAHDATLAEYYAAFESSQPGLAEYTPSRRAIRRKYQALGGLDPVDVRIASFLTPDNLVFDSPRYEVFFNGSELVFRPKNCHADAAAGFVAYMTPDDASVLPPHRVAQRRHMVSMHEDGNCLALLRHLAFRASHILAVQRNSTGEVWSGEIFLDQGAFEKVMEDMLSLAGEPVIESDMDVYIHGRRIFYVSDDGQRTDGRTGIFLRVTPTRETDVPSYLGGYVDRDFRPICVTVGERCVVRAVLPDIPIRHVRTGQYVEVMDGEEPLVRTLWEGEVTWAVFEKALEDALSAAGEPVIESDMDVYIHGRRIFYVSDDCSERTAERFFLHVTPTHERYLPPERIEHGYDNLDFEQVGLTIGKRCVARWRLPHYPIRRIRTGQYVEVAHENELRTLWVGDAEIGG